MDWIKQLNEAIKYIEEHLQDEISYEKIAQIGRCSSYNFQRIFSYIADKPLSEYIRNRRLTLAAFDVLNSNERIIDIGLKYGYESQDAFSRAFRNFHGVLPSTVRNETVSLKSCPKLSFQITAKGAKNMKYQIEKWPAFKVAGFVKRVKTEEAFQIIPKVWKMAWQDGTIEKLADFCMKTNHRPAGFLGIATGGQAGHEEEMEYILGVTNYVEVSDCIYVPASEGMTEYHYQAVTWVIINADGELPDSVQDVYKQFYSEWLPSSGYTLEDLPVIEAYTTDKNQEVWIAIK